MKRGTEALNDRGGGKETDKVDKKVDEKSKRNNGKENKEKQILQKD